MESDEKRVFEVAFLCLKVYDLNRFNPEKSEY
jgi:hypothetical protein